jgi:hypothetical protein
MSGDHKIGPHKHDHKPSSSSDPSSSGTPSDAADLKKWQKLAEQLLGQGQQPQGQQSQPQTA